MTAKMHQIRFRLRLRPRPRWGSLQRSPRPHGWIWGPLRGRGGAGEEEGGEVEGREREGPQVTVEPGPLRALLRHCQQHFFQSLLPRAGSGVVRIDPLRFLARCRTRRLTQV